MKTSEQINEISKAMSIAQGLILPAQKDSANPYFKSKFTTLKEIRERIREPLALNGLCYFQDIVSTEHGVSVTTRVCHCSGQWIEFGPLEIPLAKKDAQQIGSGSSYAQRYALKAAFGVVSSDDDDDGESAMGREVDTHTGEVKHIPLSETECAELDQLLNEDHSRDWVIREICSKKGVNTVYEIDSGYFQNDLKKWLLNRKKKAMEKKG